jgi:hypothetical protein
VFHTIKPKVIKQKIKYIELKSGGRSHNGNAWIGFVSFSKSGKTIYFDGKSFQSLSGMGISGNYFEIETGNEYWISGVKKNMSDRHQFGGGKIFVEKRILKDYLKIIKKKALPKSGYELIEVQTEKPIERIDILENEIIEPAKFSQDLHFKEPNELTNDEIEFVISELYEEEENAKFNKGRRFVKKKRIEFEAELEKRK